MREKGRPASWISSPVHTALGGLSSGDESRYRAEEFWPPILNPAQGLGVLIKNLLLFLPSKASRLGREKSHPQGASGEEHKASLSLLALLRLRRRDWKCQGGLGTDLGLGRRQIFQDGEMREGILLGVGLDKWNSLSFSPSPTETCQCVHGPASFLWGQGAKEESGCLFRPKSSYHEVHS